MYAQIKEDLEMLLETECKNLVSCKINPGKSLGYKSLKSITGKSASDETKYGANYSVGSTPFNFTNGVFVGLQGFSALLSGREFKSL